MSRLRVGKTLLLLPAQVRRSSPSVANAPLFCIPYPRHSLSYCPQTQRLKTRSKADLQVRMDDSYEVGSAQSLDRSTARAQQDSPVSATVWNPQQGILFSTPPRPVSDVRATASTSSISAGLVHNTHLSIPNLGRRAISSSSLEGLGRDVRVTPRQDSGNPAIPRVRSNLESRNRKQRPSPKVQPSRSFSSRHRPQHPRKDHPRDPPAGIKTQLREFLWTAIDNLPTFLALPQHWLATLLGLPSLSLSFASSSALGSFLPTILRPIHPSPSHQPSDRRTFWTYKNDSTALDSCPSVRICTDLTTAEKVASSFLAEPVVGLDLEWQAFGSATSGIKSNVSLIQIASPTHIALFHLARFPGSTASELLPPNLQRLLEDPAILKTGVNIAGDCTRLRRHLGVDPRGIVELSHSYRLVKYHDGDVDDVRKINKTLVALAVQAEEHLGRPLYKEDDVRASDWTQPLTDEQTLYAASDAYACLRLWDVLDTKRAALDPAPPRPACWEAKEPIRLASGRTVAEHLASQRVDAAVVQEVVQRDSDAESEIESDSESDDEMALSGDVIASSGQSSPSFPSSPDSSPDPRSEADAAHLDAAAAWTTTTLASVSSTKPLRRQLIAYHLYHAQGLPPKRVGALLDIKPTSAACYVLESILVAKVPYERERLEREVLPRVPPRVREGRFWMFVKAKGT